MSFNPDKIIEELLKVQRIKERVEELDLTREQLIESIPIFLDMKGQTDDKNTKFLTSFYVENGEVKRVEVRSSYWEKYKYLENIKTLNIEHVDFEDEKEFIKEPQRKHIVNKIKDYLEDKKYCKGLYIYGDMGIGKTFLLKRIAKKLAEEDFEVGFINLVNLVTIIKSTFGNNDYYKEIISILKNVHFLFLDDIGAESIAPWFRDDILFSILNHRMQKDKSTFFSSNYSLEKLAQIESQTLKQKYRDFDKSARLISRIRSLTEQIILIGNNKR